MCPDTPLDIDSLRGLEKRLQSLLHAHPEGLGEYELLKQLQAEAVAPFTGLRFDDSLTLFRHHFLLYHLLYRLAARVAGERTARLEIDALCIRLGTYVAPNGHLPDDHDPMAEYYLDLGNLQAMDREGLHQMLGGFWSGQQARAGRCDALAVLGLHDPVSDQVIKRRYRRLAQEWHPDRGGDTERLQSLNAAMATLARTARSRRR